eukprot:CAMPEP_0197711386 /NCGR_PEP_ID=MMETSP1338-20131121/129429_1 /TAXON_ID=43686 ORGANISM="Pelagodinium beii, Strain RCC1491" /NCGR_SAMPLE_ID=MMETSP1338 /ASSEMBLY_ACC=CAM_ASM_000754 /LENGTH=176 /DNA_ID=CAMNT_0043295319 /DNA_START=910 /DNA_END=1441 /DNA_ORIENTATION=+
MTNEDARLNKRLSIVPDRPLSVAPSQTAESTITTTRLLWRHVTGGSDERHTFQVVDVGTPLFAARKQMNEISFVKAQCMRLPHAPTVVSAAAIQDHIISTLLSQPAYLPCNLKSDLGDEAPKPNSVLASDAHTMGKKGRLKSVSQYTPNTTLISSSSRTEWDMNRSAFNGCSSTNA